VYCRRWCRWVRNDHLEQFQYDDLYMQIWQNGKQKLRSEISHLPPVFFTECISLGITSVVIVVDGYGVRDIMLICLTRKSEILCSCVTCFMMASKHRNSFVGTVTYTVWVNPPPYGFLKFFPKRLGIFNQYFTHLLCDHFYTRVQIFIQISLTLTKLCHTKREHLTNFYISLEL